MCPSVLHFRRIDASAGTCVEGYRYKSSEGSDPSLIVEIDTALSVVAVDLRDMTGRLLSASEGDLYFEANELGRC